MHTNMDSVGTLHSTSNHHLNRQNYKICQTDDFVISAFIDLKKAFDCVPTNTLLTKLQAYDIRCDYIKLLFFKILLKM